ncbi:MAG TPA: hypothetical protein VMD48_00200 [Solirubrobacteraceae bacterium]|nr:hypothetical protein [Solirubrobacteraceae bacterium]
MRYATARLDEFERLSAFGQHGVWRPVRHHFGIEGFGINAYTADQPGDRVIEEHTEIAAAEDLGRHQELYVVLTGRASFTLDGEDIDAPAGTFVFVGEPDVRRGAVAAEPATTVLAMGARPGVAFEISPWEYRFRAAALGPCSEAYELLAEAEKRFPSDTGILYDRACLHARERDRDAALAELTRATEVKPETREWARHDEDFKSLRGDPEFEQLVRG